MIPRFQPDYLKSTFPLCLKCHDRTRFVAHFGRTRSISMRREACPKRTAIELDVADLLQMGVCLHEVSDHQAFSCRRWSQDERQPRGCILERTEGGRRRARHYLDGADWHDRF